MLEINKATARAWSMIGSCGAYGIAVTDLAESDEKLAVVTADLCFFSGLERLKASMPEKLYNVGIAEQNMVGVAAGLAKEGFNTFASTYASFACTRVMDQVKMTMGYMKLPVRLIGLTAGYSVGILGPTHMSIEDIAIMRTIPNITVLSPADCGEIVKCVYAASKFDGPVYIRLSGAQRVPIVYSEEYDFEIGKAIELKDGKDIAVFATGTTVYEALKAAEKLENEGISCAVINMHTLKPIDKKCIEKYMSYKHIVSVEEHSVIGGLGSAIADVIVENGSHTKLTKIGIDDYYLHAGNFEYLLKQSGLDSESIYGKIKSILK